ncbi:putative transcription factor bHLH107 [Prosopis cineraria]|uniref:putative transcription factor bHLH107 n=1 Tax=Prosopis cineraria TaxID=364024 RepID=UPI00240F57E8|nr:putative transcription factor bHLH107 [Prosopis cineraria]
MISIEDLGTTANCSYNSISSSATGSDISRLFNPTSHKIVDSNGVSQGALASPNSLVLNGEKEDLMKSPINIGKKEASEAKALAAMKNHSEAERRRRERINGHLDTLRGLVPSNAKMDKATLLAEVINQVKLLKKNAMEASRGFLIPMDDDEVKVESCNHEGRDGSMFYMASICCDYRPELLSDLRQALDGLQLQLMRAEISTLGGRVKNVFFFRCCKTEHINIEACQLVPSTVHQVLSSVLERASSSLEYSLGMSLRSKRRRLCFLETSTSS